MYVLLVRANVSMLVSPGMRMYFKGLTGPGGDVWCLLLETFKPIMGTRGGQSLGAERLWNLR